MNERLDIAPAFRKLLSVLPVEILAGYRKSLLEDESSSPMLQEMAVDVDREIDKRGGKMRIEDIKVYLCYEEHSPKKNKLEAKRQQYLQTGLQEFDIVLDSRGYLINGYCGYLLAKEYGLTVVSVRYGRRQIVRAFHKRGGELYAWELPGTLVDRVKPGEKLIVETSRGLRTVTVAAVEEYAGQPAEGLKMAFRKPRGRGGERR